MKRTTAAGRSGKDYDDEAAVVEVGPLSGALSPFESWTRNPASTPNCDRGRESPCRSTLTRIRCRGLSPLPTSILQEGSMQVLYPRCAGLDIHKRRIQKGYSVRLKMFQQTREKPSLRNAS
jgi:hypothetical protein